ncbi:hypothetical protein [Streptomyces sp. SYP-A7185]|uniref:hypothetical protein n=1 Tax=Streptomyces sp. SYP-A7185 TaxID=3040076 RepID=UPI0038F7A01E
MSSRNQDLPFPIPIATVNTPSRSTSWRQGTIYWSTQETSLEAVFSSLSVNAAADGADEVLGVRAEWVGGSSRDGGWRAYGTAIWYVDTA